MLNCAWQNLYWWHGFTCCCGGRDDYLGVGTSSARSSGDGVVCRKHSLMAGWGRAGGRPQNELPYAVLSVCLAERPLPAYPYLCFSLLPLELAPLFLCLVWNLRILGLPGSMFFKNCGSSEVQVVQQQSLSSWGWQQEANRMTHIWPTSALCRIWINQVK